MSEFRFRSFDHPDPRIRSAYRVFDGERCIGSVIRLPLGGWRARDLDGGHVADWHTRAEAACALLDHV